MFDSSDVTNVTKIERSLNSIPIYHLSSSLGIEEYAMLRRTAPSIVPYEMWMAHNTHNLLLNVSPGLISGADSYDSPASGSIVALPVYLECVAGLFFPLFA